MFFFLSIGWLQMTSRHFCCGANCRWRAGHDFSHRKHNKTLKMATLCILYGCSNWSTCETTRSFYQEPKAVVHKGERKKRLVNSLRLEGAKSDNGGNGATLAFVLIYGATVNNQGKQRLEWQAVKGPAEGDNGRQANSQLLMLSHMSKMASRVNDETSQICSIPTQFAANCSGAVRVACRHFFYLWPHL